MKNATIRLILCAFVMLELFSASAYAAINANPAGDQPTKLTIQDQTGTYGGTLTLSATLTTTANEPVPNAKIAFAFANYQTYYGNTDNNGVATANASLADIDVGTRRNFITVSYAGIQGSYKSSSVNATLIVNPAPTTLSVSNVQASAGNLVTLSATLSAGSMTLSTKQVSFSVNGVSKGNAYTDANGTATLSGVSVADLAAGDYQILAGFSPTGGNYAASTGTGTLTLTARPTQLEILPSTGTEGVYGGTVTLQAKLTSSGSGVSGKTISITFNGSTYTPTTDGTGLASVSGVSIAGIDVGTYTNAISASFAASGGYTAASAKGDLKVTPASTSLSVANASGDYGGTTSLSATLTSGGSAVSEQTIIFSLNGTQVGSAPTGSNGTATLTGVPLTGLDAATYTGVVTASFAGSKNYSGSSGPAANLTVNKATTTLTVSPSTGPYGGSASLSATLSSGSTKLSGMEVSFSFHGASYSGTTDGNGTVTINNVSLSGIDANTYTDYFTASFNGNGNYKATSGNGNLTVNPAPTSLTTEDVTGAYGANVNLTATLTSLVTNQGIAGKDVYFSIDGSQVGYAATASGGVATLNINPDVGVGTHKIRATFSDPLGNYATSTSEEKTLTITALPTVISVTPVTGTYGGTVTLQATLSSSGSLLNGKTIYFSVNEKPAGNASTVSGVANLSFSLGNINAGLYDIKADFLASDGYQAAADTATLKVDPATAILNVPEVTGTFGGTVDLSATLTSGGSPLQGKSVTFKLGTLSLDPAQTVANGIATLKGVSLSGFNAGSHPGAITAEFNSDPNYVADPASGDLTVNQAPTVLTAENVTAIYGSKVSLTARLTSSGNNLNNEKISFKLNGNFVDEAYTVDGLATLNDVNLGDLPVGVYKGKIEAIYSPSGGNYAASTDTSWLEVTPAATILALEKVEAPYGSTVTLKATLSSGNTLLSGRTISFSLNGATKGTATTGLDGVARYDLSLAGIGVGSYPDYIGASFSPQQDNYSGSSIKADLKITELPTELVITKAEGTYGAAAEIAAKLTSSGTPLANKTVSFTFNGVKYPAATDAGGIATVSQVSIAGLDAGKYPVNADFEAIDGYEAKSAKDSLTIVSAATSLSVNKVTGTYGGLVELSARLTSGNVILNGRSISFKLNGKYVGSAPTTEPNGTAILKNVSLTGIDAGTPNVITADFAGEKNYGPSTGSENLAVKQAPVTVLVTNVTGPYNGKVDLTAKLTDSTSGTPLGGSTLSFKLGTALINTAQTGNDGVATLKDVSIALIPVGTYTDYIEVSFSPLAGNYAPGKGKGQLEVIQAQTVLAVKNVTAVYGSKDTLKATLTSLELPVSGKTIEFLLNGKPVGTAVTDTKGFAFKPDVDLSAINVGQHPAYLGAGFAGDESYLGSNNTADLTITKASTAVSVLPSEVQYSDQVTLTAVVTSPAAQPGLNTSGGSVVFKYQLGDGAETFLGSVSSSTVSEGRLTFSYNFNCMLDPKTYKIHAYFTPTDQVNFNDSFNASPYGPLLVNHEDATAEYTGLTYFSTASPTSMNVTLTYSATITDFPDDSRGNITNARVDFIEDPEEGIFDKKLEGGTNLPVFLVDPAVQTVGTSSTQPVSRNVSSSTFNKLGATFNVYTKVRGNYSKLSDPTLITIGIPGNDNISGGGFITSTHSAGKYHGKAGSKANFGFTMKYNKSGKNNQGQANIIIRGEDDKMYQIKSNAVNSMSVYTIKGLPGKAASFDTKANLTDITDPLYPVALGGSLSLTVEMYDGLDDKENDAIAITLQDPGTSKDPGSGLLYSSNWSGTKTILTSLGAPNGGGNIKVLSSSGLAKGMSEEMIPKEYALYQNFPNPFNPSTNIQFDLPEDSRVKIVIYNILGGEVATLINDELPAGKHQAVWNSQDGGGQSASGMYIMRITAKSLTSQRNLVSTKKMMLVK